MTGVFQPVTVEWDGKKYVIPSNRVMGAIKVVEKTVTMKELSDYMQNPGKAKFASLAEAYSDFLTYAGVPNMDEDTMYKLLLNNDKDQQSVLFTATFGLMALMMPSSVLIQAAIDDGTTDEGKKPKGKKKPTVAK